MDKKYDPKNLFLKGQRFIESKAKEKSKSQPEESFAKRVKLRRQKAKWRAAFIRWLRRSKRRNRIENTNFK